MARGTMTMYPARIKDRGKGCVIRTVPRRNKVNHAVATDLFALLIPRRPHNLAMR
jgi:hypothetical protein